MRRIYLALLGSLVQPGLAVAKTYQVQRGDTLGQIAKTHVGSPIWGAHGSVKKLLELNPDIKDPNRIFVGQTINLSPEAPAAEMAATPEPAAEGAEAAPPVPEEVEPVKDAQAAGTEGDGAAQRPSPGFEFEVEGLLSMTSLDADARDRSFETSPDSKINQGLKLGIAYRISERSKVAAEAGFVKSRFADSKDGRLNGNDKVLKSFGLSYHYRPFERWDVSLGASSGQQYFVGQLAPQKYQIEPIFVDSLSLGLSYDILVAGEWTLTLGGALGHVLPSEGDSAEPKSGTKQSLSSDLSYRVSPSLDLRGGLSFERRNQGTELVKQISNESAATLGIVVRK